jgi:hypothetical protein
MSSTDTTAQAGWYAVGSGFERYWDGSAWTERLRPVPSYVHEDASHSHVPVAVTSDSKVIDIHV